MSSFSYSIVVATLIALASGSASAACTSPVGVEGEVIYNTDYATMQFCDNTSWVSMAASGSITAEVDPQVGTLTGSKWCKANAGATAIDCGVTAINLATDVTGNLPITSLPSLASANIWVGNGSSVATAVTLSGDVTMTNAGATVIGAGAVTIGKLSATGTPSTTTFLRGDGTWAAPSTSQWLNGASSAIYYNAGNVGIGTATPSSKLHVAGTSNFTGTMNLPTGAGVTTIEVYGSGTRIIADNGLYLNGYNGALWLDVNSAGLNPKFVFSGGNVGIGTTTPSATLQVVNPSAAQPPVKITNSYNVNSLEISHAAYGNPIAITDTGFISSISVTKTTSAVASNLIATGLSVAATYAHSGLSGLGSGINLTVVNNTGSSGTLYGANICLLAVLSG